MMTRESRPAGRATARRSTSGTARGRPAEQTRHNGQGQRETRSATLRLPFLTTRFELPQPSGNRVHLGPVALPSPVKTAYYVGLGALAVAEVVEWPIATAIAAGTYIAQHTRAEETAVPQFEHGPGEQAREKQREPAGARA